MMPTTTTLHSDKYQEVLWQSTTRLPSPVVWHPTVMSAYTVTGRYYHNLRHIEECLQEFNEVKDEAKHPVELEFAILFHDVIYNTHRDDNEEQSASLAHDLVSAAMKLSGESVSVASSCALGVRNLIMVTKQHEWFTHHDDAMLMSDIDLGILGKPPKRFREYEAAIRQEYGWVDIQVYAQKRLEVLLHFLKRRSIYATKHFKGKYEKQARKNLRESIARLKKIVS